jgi:hypothetical protein
VVDSASGEAPPPPELRIAWQCERWNCLPDAGGYLDQDFVTVTRMTALSNVYNAVVRIKSLTGKNIHKLTDSERRILRVLKDEGIIFT